MDSFPYPIHLSDLAQFAHRDPAHMLARPARIGRDALAGNGWLAIRVHRGAWLDSEVPEATADFAARMEALPWDLFPTLKAGGWRSLADRRGFLTAKHGRLAVWHDDRPQLFPSPVWQIAGGALVRLSMLQLVARLPRAEMHVFGALSFAPLPFRFSGGCGFMAPFPTRQQPFSGELWPLERDAITGARIAHQTPTRHIGFENKTGWPPPEPND